MVNDLWLAALTKSDDDSGTNNRFNVTVNVDGRDVLDHNFVLGHPSEDNSYRVMARGAAGLEAAGPLDEPFESAALTHSSIRLGLRGDDAWGPQNAMVIGRTLPAFTPGRTVALALETDIQRWLSSDSPEGRLSMPLRLVGEGTPATLIHRVIVLLQTAEDVDAETKDRVQFEIVAGGGIVMQERIDRDLLPQAAHWLTFDAATPFTRADLVANGRIRISLLGNDEWLPKTMFVFGLDTPSGRPDNVVTLSSVPEWNLGWLSADPQQGAPAVDLPRNS
jgi:hypothetical protein